MPRQRIAKVGGTGRPTTLEREALEKARQVVYPYVQRILEAQLRRAVEEGHTGAARLCLEVVDVVGPRRPVLQDNGAMLIVSKALEIAAALAQQIRREDGGFIIEGEVVEPPECPVPAEQPSLVRSES